jgi:hypothetical protein
MVAWAEIAFLEETLDLLDDALVEAAAADRLDDGQGRYLPKDAVVRWSDQNWESVRRGPAAVKCGGPGRLAR